MVLWEDSWHRTLDWTTPWTYWTGLDPGPTGLDDTLDFSFVLLFFCFLLLLLDPGWPGPQRKTQKN